MVYKGVFCRTNHSIALCNDGINSIQCQVPCNYQVVKLRKCYSNGLRWPSSHLLYIVAALFVLILCSSICSHALPTSHNSGSINSVVRQSPKSQNVDRNRVFRQTSNENNLSTESWQKDLTQRAIIGFKLMGDEKSILSSEDAYTIKANAKVAIRLLGVNANISHIGFSNEAPDQIGEKCHLRPNKAISIQVTDFMAVAKISLPSDSDSKSYYLCYSISGMMNDFHYATGPQETWFRINVEAALFPTWLQIIMIIALLMMSGLFSGLNLGLMALDKNELQVIERCGTEQEKYWSRSITPVRKRGNYLLCTLLLGNVLVNSTLTIFMDDLTSGLFAVIGSTLCIVIFGEIIPQAMCSRHGLAVGAKTIYITYLFMGITFPLSYPISLILDKILGEEIGNVYDRERLMEYIRVTKDYNRLEADEMNIISGALKFKNIKVVDVMTPIDDVFMLPYDTILNFDTLTLINNSGYSRIPVYENDRDNVVGILHVKDLSLIDADHKLPLKVVIDFYSHPLFSAFEDVTLDVMLNEFKKGKSHMALIRRVIDNGVNDPFYELLGVVTLEDIIEELIQAEINDETDVISDNRRKQKRKDVQSRSTYLDFIRYGFKNDTERALGQGEQTIISPQLALATFRFLASSVEPFRPDYLSEEVLKNLMSKNVYFVAKGENRKPKISEMSPENVLYIRGMPADYFIMILEGRARVIVTKENQEYDAGPFCCFGISSLINAKSNPEAQNEERGSLSHADSSEAASDNQALSPLNSADSNGSLNASKDGHFVPDFTLFCVEKTIYMKVTRDLYKMAIGTTILEKGQRSSSMNKSPSGDTHSATGKCDSKSNSEEQLLKPKERKVSQYMLDNNQIRRMSKSTNLPDAFLLQDQLSRTLSNDSSGKPPTDPNRNRTATGEFASSNSNSKTLDQESEQLKRSDAVEMLSDVDKSPSESNDNLVSLKPLDSHKSDTSDSKPGNGLLNSHRANSLSKVPPRSEKRKSTDLEEHDETTHLIE